MALPNPPAAPVMMHDLLAKDKDMFEDSLYLTRKKTDIRGFGSILIDCIELENSRFFKPVQRVSVSSPVSIVSTKPSRVEATR